MLGEEELNKNKEIFDDIYSRVEIAIETEDYYNSPYKEYVTYVVVVDSRVDRIDRKIKSTAKFMKGKIPVAFKIGYLFTEETIIPQDIHEIIEQPLFAVEAARLFTEKNWPTTYRSWLMEAIQNTIKMVTLETESGRFKQHSFRVRSVQML